ncbi:MAG: ABC transporter substrate-binding protein [Myxococcales bacterium]
MHGLIDKGVIAVIGPEGDELAKSLPPILEPLGIPLITPSSSSAPVEVSAETSLWFRLAPSAEDLGTAMGRYLRTEGVTDIAIVSTDTEYDTSFSAAVAARLEEADIAIAISENILPSAADFTDVVHRVVDAAPKAIVLAADASTGSRFVNDYDFVLGSTDGVKWYLSPQLEQPGFLLNTSPEDVEGMIGVAAAVSPVKARTDAFTKAFEERWDGAAPTTGAFYYYDALALFAVAFEGAATKVGNAHPDPETLRSYMLSSSGQSGLVVEWDELPKGLENASKGEAVYYTGVTGVLSLDEAGARSAVYTRLWTIEGGQVVPLPEAQAE